MENVATMAFESILKVLYHWNAMNFCALSDSKDVRLFYLVGTNFLVQKDLPSYCGCSIKCFILL